MSFFVMEQLSITFFSTSLSHIFFPCDMMCVCLQLLDSSFFFLLTTTTFVDIYIHISWAGRFLFRFLFSFVLFFFFWRAYRLYHLLTYYHHYHDDFIILYKTYMTMSVCVCAYARLFSFHFPLFFFFVSFVCFCSFPLIMISSKHASRFTPFGRHLVDTNTQYIDFIHLRWGAIVGATFFLLPLCLSIFFLLYYAIP